MVVVSPDRKESSCRSYNGIKWLVSNVLVAITAFHAGFTTKTNMMVLQDCPPHCSHHQHVSLPQPKNNHNNNNNNNNDISKIGNMWPKTPKEKSRSLQQEEGEQTSTHNRRQLFPPTLERLLVSMGRVNRDDFARMFDVGVPLMPSSTGNEEVLILYGDDFSLPNANTSLPSSSSTTDIPLYKTQDATQNCLTMKMILFEPEQRHQCLAIMGQWPAHMIHQWRRRIKLEKATARERDRASLDQPLRLVSRAYQRLLDGPIDVGVKDAFSSFVNYATHMNDVLEALRPVAASVGYGKPYNNTIVVTLCNHGQSELFLNFVCAARARGLDTSQVLLFATDVETKELADAFGITAFYDEKIFGDVPIRAAKQFGDRTFKQLIMTKVYCLHLIHQLGYNILYQDADVLWYKQPLEFFSSPDIGDFDMYLQDDGARDVQDEQYHANGGFFYIRHNKRTAYFLSNLIRYGEYIWKENEQYAMNNLLNEHASFTGLRAKVLNREEVHFPGGWNFHRRPEMMKDIVQGKVVPYIFHMSWNNHKVEKRNYLEQLGAFFVAEQCVGKTAPELTKGMGKNETTRNSTEVLASACCVAEPVVTCHYRDKPSKIPCHESPPIDKDMPSFW